MTVGKPLLPLLFFALPRMAGSVVQQLYTIVDSMVVGNLLGVEAFAAVGATGFLFTLMMGLISGFVQGAGIVVAQHFGAKDPKNMNRAVASGIRLCLVLGGALTLAGVLLARPVLLLIQTPADILAGSVLYITILFAGTLVNIFNYLAISLLLSLGDSRSTLISTVISSLVNIVLDVLFVGVFHMGIAGVALGTILAWLSALIYCALKLRRLIHLKPGDFCGGWASDKAILRLGAPMSFRDFVINSGGLVIQSFINGYGSLFVAGFSMSQKFFGLMQMVGEGFDGATSVFVAQNFGSKNMKRIRQGMAVSLLLSLSGAVVTGAIFIIFGPLFLSTLISGEAEKIGPILDIAYQSLVVTALGIPFLYLLYLFRSGIQGMGKTLVPTLSGFLELLGRLAAVVLLPGLIGVWGIYLSSAVGWVLAAALLTAGFIHHFRAESARLSHGQ